MSSLADNVHFVEAIPCPAAGNSYAGTKTSDVIGMANASECTFMVYRGAGGTGTTTITVLSCDDFVPTTSTAIAFEYKLITTGTAAHTEGDWTAATTAGFTTAVTANVIYLCRAKSEDLVDGDIGIKIVCTESADDPVGGAVIAMLSGYRYPQENKISAIA